MKLNVWTVFALAPLTSVMLLAQQTTPSPNSGAAPDTAATTPAKKGARGRKRVVLDPPATASIKTSNVNVRGRASFAGETLGHVQKGDTVTVLAQITLNHPTKDEPAEWAQIVLPPSIPVWVDGAYIDSDAKTVKARRVNLRGGPGENFSVVGRLEKGAPIKQIKSENGWVAIEAPTNAFAYVAAEFLEMLPPPTVAVTAPTPVAAPTPAPEEVNVATPATPAVAAPAAPNPADQKTETQIELDALHRATAAEAAPTPAPDTSATATNSEPAKPRVVTREGFVRRAYNVQSPTDFELHDIQTGKLIDYIDPMPGQNFKIFLGTRITVTGPEGMDSRWTRTPVLHVQSVDLMP